MRENRCCEYTTDYWIVKNPALPPLTGLRFIAAFLVCSAHMVPALVAANSVWMGVQLWSAEGMTLFFVLSGFVIHYNYSEAIIRQPQQGIYEFFTARFARLVPLFMVCLLLDIMLTYHREHHLPTLTKALPYYLTMTQSWFYRILGQNNLIYQFGKISQVSWSISTEWFFYFCYPVICFFILKAVRIQTKLFCLIGIGMIAIYSIWFFTAHLPEINQLAVAVYGPYADFYTQNQDSYFRWLIYFAPFLRLTEFLTGCLVAALFMQLRKRHVSPNEEKLGLVMIIGALIIIALTHHYIWQPPAGSAWMMNLHRNYGFAPGFALLIFCCARYQNSFTRLLSCWPVLLGGEISYSLYLLHTAIIEFITNHFSGVLSGMNILVNFVLLTGVIMFVSYLSYRIIEAPARRLLRKKAAAHTN